MSGFNHRTKRYEPTWTNLNWWWTRSESKPTTTEGFAEHLRKEGVKVFSVHPRWIECENRPDLIMKALRGPGYKMNPEVAFIMSCGYIYPEVLPKVWRSRYKPGFRPEWWLMQARKRLVAAGLFTNADLDSDGQI